MSTYNASEEHHIKQMPNESKNIRNNEIYSKENMGIDTNKNVSQKDINHVENIDFDVLLPHAGEFGRYQLKLFLLTMPFYMFGVFTYFTQMFLTEVSSQHWCWIPELENLTALERRTLAIPVDENNRYGYSQCSAYVANWSDVVKYGDIPGPDWKTTTCQHGWEFNKSEIPYATISSELGWVCDRDSYQATAQSIFFIGSIFGGFIIGWLADRFGRITGAVVSNVIGCIGGVATIFANDFLEFAICRFFTGFAYDNCMMMVYILILEYTAPRYRTIVSNMTFALFFGVSACVLPWIALVCDNWRTLALATSIPMLLALLTPFVMPESPRWLLSKNRVNDAIDKLLSIARVNKKEVPQKLVEQFKYSFEHQTNTGKSNKLEIVKRPLLRNMFMLICLLYVCVSIIFDALVRSVGQLEFDFFISFTLVSFTEIPSCILVAFVMDWIGRRWLVAIFLSVSSVFCFCTAFLGGGLSAVLCAVIARFCVNMACNAAIQWAAEIFPTDMRASGAATVHIFGYVATIISPYIVYLETVLPWLPLVVVGCVAIVGVFTALALPETAGREMPQTYDDAENLARSWKFWYMPCLNKKGKRNEGENNQSFEP